MYGESFVCTEESKERNANILAVVDASSRLYFYSGQTPQGVCDRALYLGLFSGIFLTCLYRLRHLTE